MRRGREEARMMGSDRSYASNQDGSDSLGQRKRCREDSRGRSSDITTSSGSESYRRRSDGLLSLSGGTLRDEEELRGNMTEWPVERRRRGRRYEHDDFVFQVPGESLVDKALRAITASTSKQSGLSSQRSSSVSSVSPDRRVLCRRNLFSTPVPPQRQAVTKLSFTPGGNPLNYTPGGCKLRTPYKDVPLNFRTPKGDHRKIVLPPEPARVPIWENGQQIQGGTPVRRRPLEVLIPYAEPVREGEDDSPFKCPVDAPESDPHFDVRFWYETQGFVETQQLMARRATDTVVRTKHVDHLYAERRAIRDTPKSSWMIEIKLPLAKWQGALDRSLNVNAQDLIATRKAKGIFLRVRELPEGGQLLEIQVKFSNFASLALLLQSLGLENVKPDLYVRVRSYLTFSYVDQLDAPSKVLMVRKYGVFKDANKLTFENKEPKLTRTENCWRILMTGSSKEYVAAQVMNTAPSMLQNAKFKDALISKFDSKLATTSLDKFVYPFCLGWCPELNPDLYSKVENPKNPLTLWISGPPGNGKTEWAKAVFGGENPEQLLWVREVNALRRFNPLLHKVILMDDIVVTSKAIDPQNLLNLLDMRNAAQVRILYDSIYIPLGVRRVITSNYSAAHILQEFSGPQEYGFLRRVSSLPINFCILKDIPEEEQPSSHTVGYYNKYTKRIVAYNMGTPENMDILRKTYGQGWINKYCDVLVEQDHQKEMEARRVEGERRNSEEEGGLRESQDQVEDVGGEGSTTSQSEGEKQDFLEVSMHAQLLSEESLFKSGSEGVATFPGVSKKTLGLAKRVFCWSSLAKTRRPRVLQEQEGEERDYLRHWRISWDYQAFQRRTNGEKCQEESGPAPIISVKRSLGQLRIESEVVIPPDVTIENSTGSGLETSSDGGSDSSGPQGTPAAKQSVPAPSKCRGQSLECQSSSSMDSSSSSQNVIEMQLDLEGQKSGGEKDVEPKEKDDEARG